MHVRGAASVFAVEMFGESGMHLQGGCSDGMHSSNSHMTYLDDDRISPM